MKKLQCVCHPKCHIQQLWLLWVCILKVTSPSHMKLLLLCMCTLEVTSRLTTLCTILYRVSSTCSLFRACGNLTTALPFLSWESCTTPLPRWNWPQEVTSFLRNKSAPIHSPHSHTTIFYFTHHFPGRSRIRLLRGWTVAESVNREDQQSPEQDHDANDSGTSGDEHLWRCINIRFNYILYRCQVVNIGTTLPNQIQPARVAKSPDDIDWLASLPPRLQVERLLSYAALSVLQKGVQSGLPLLQVLDATAWHIARHTYKRRSAVSNGAEEGPLPHQKGPRGPARAPRGSVNGLPHPLLGTALAGSRPSIASSGPPQRRP